MAIAGRFGRTSIVSYNGEIIGEQELKKMAEVNIEIKADMSRVKTAMEKLSPTAFSGLLNPNGWSRYKFSSKPETKERLAEIADMAVNSARFQALPAEIVRDIVMADRMEASVAIGDSDIQFITMFFGTHIIMLNVRNPSRVFVEETSKIEEIEIDSEYHSWEEVQI